MKHYSTYQSQFIEMFEGDKYPRLSLDAISEEWSKGQGFKKDDICEDGETQCIHYGELFTKYGPVINEVVSRTSVEKKKTSKKGDILFPASDVTPNGLARCSMLPFDNVILGGDIIILRPKENYNAAYLSYAINQQTSQLLTRVNGGVVKHMSAKGLKTVEIPIPPMDKQEEYIKIAEQADKSKFTSLKSQFIEMLNTEGYEYLALGEVCSKITDGSHNPPKGCDSSDYIMISSKNISPDYLDLSDVRYLTKDEFESENKRTNVSANDILLTIVGTIGRTYLVKGNEGNIVMQRSVAVLTPKKNINPTFLMYSLLIDSELEKEGRGNAQKGVYLKQLAKYKVKIPSFKCQNKFCEIYNQADKSKLIRYS